MVANIPLETLWKRYLKSLENGWTDPNKWPDLVNVFITMSVLSFLFNLGFLGVAWIWPMGFIVGDLYLGLIIWPSKSKYYPPSCFLPRKHQVILYVLAVWLFVLTFLQCYWQIGVH